MEEEWYWIKPNGENLQIGQKDRFSNLWYTCGSEQAAPEPVLVGPRVKACHTRMWLMEGGETTET